MVKILKHLTAGVIACSFIAATNGDSMIHTANQLAAANLQVYNYLGTGSNPNLSITLSATGVSGWGVGYTIGYQGSGGIPCSNNANNNWSSWDVKDTNSNYYGTITLFTNATCTTILNNPKYVNNTQNGYNLSGVTIVNGNGVSVKSISCPNNNCSSGGGSGAGPFPNTPASTPPGNFNLSVSGSQILANGQPIKIKGIVRPSLEWNNQGQYLSPADMKNIAVFAGSSPTNAIRIDINAAYWNSSAPATTSGSYQQIIDAMVYYATQNNMLVILDYHWFNSSVQQQNMAPKDPTNASLTFWTSVANKYKNYNNVIFELYNEPYSLPYNTWLNGDANWYGMQDLYNTVRATGAKNLVIANGLDYAYYLGFLTKGVNNCGSSDCLIKDSSHAGGYAYNVIYGSHPYSVGNGNYKGQSGYTYYPTGGGSPAPADFTSNFAGIQTLYPIIFTEFGDNQAADYSNSTYINIYNAILGEINTANINSTGFAWWIDPTEPQFPTLICGNWSNPTACLGGSLIKNNMIAAPATQLNFNQQ